MHRESVHPCTCTPVLTLLATSGSLQKCKGTEDVLVFPGTIRSSQFKRLRLSCLCSPEQLNLLCKTGNGGSYLSGNQPLRWSKPTAHRWSVSKEIPQCISVPTQIAAVSVTLLSVKKLHLARFAVGVIFLLTWLISATGCHGYVKTCCVEQYA